VRVRRTQRRETRPASSTKRRHRPGLTARQSRATTASNNHARNGDFLRRRDRLRLTDRHWNLRSLLRVLQQASRRSPRSELTRGSILSANRHRSAERQLSMLTPCACSARSVLAYDLQRWHRRSHRRVVVREKRWTRSHGLLALELLAERDERRTRVGQWTSLRTNFQSAPLSCADGNGPFHVRRAGAGNRLLAANAASRACARPSRRTARHSRADRDRSSHRESFNGRFRIRGSWCT
jgi:hypothetical protein